MLSHGEFEQVMQELLMKTSKKHGGAKIVATENIKNESLNDQSRACITKTSISCHQDPKADLFITQR